MVDGWLGYSDNNATQPSWGLGLAELGKIENINIFENLNLTHLCTNFVLVLTLNFLYISD